MSALNESEQRTVPVAALDLLVLVAIATETLRKLSPGEARDRLSETLANVHAAEKKARA